MVLFQIPDIRHFWSQDPRFLQQFSAGKVTQFKPYSKYPNSSKDISFWLTGSDVHENDVYDIVREVAGELVEEVKEVSTVSSRENELTVGRSTGLHTQRRDAQAEHIG